MTMASSRFSLGTPEATWRLMIRPISASPSLRFRRPALSLGQSVILNSNLYFMVVSGFSVTFLTGKTPDHLLFFITGYMAVFPRSAQKRLSLTFFTTLSRIFFAYPADDFFIRLSDILLIRLSGVATDCEKAMVMENKPNNRRLK